MSAPDRRDDTPEPLASRALAWHRLHGRACSCMHGGHHPCPTCQAAVVALIDLLDGVSRDAIEVTTRAWERLT
jgi:hypothetical protein